MEVHPYALSEKVGKFNNFLNFRARTVWLNFESYVY